MSEIQMPGVIAVQAFNKADTVISTLESLSRCTGAERYVLLILQDGLSGSKRADVYRSQHKEARSALEAWSAQNRHKFSALSFEAEERNRGTCATAELLINRALMHSDWCIFTEDDVFFERDALEWFERAVQHSAFASADVWAVAGESKFFDARHHEPPPEDVRDAVLAAENYQLIDRYVYFEWLPSSCFATTRTKWAEFGHTRGTPNGDRDVNLRCRMEGKVSLWPVVARCSDRGMHHPFGYSVTLKKGTEEVPPKNTYITSSMLSAGTWDMQELMEGKGALFECFTKRWEAQP